MGKNDIAVDLIAKALAIKPDYAEANNSLGNVLKEMEKLDEAVASYHIALAIKPDYAIAHYNLGNAFYDLGKLWSRRASRPARRRYAHRCGSVHPVCRR